ncbi:hypothetical protein C0991_009910 [Blastosporella zonata]|nr:hypothetical protein C0991_009910 [Blastosporella zonata]
MVDRDFSSPNNLGYYVQNAQYTPESPLTNSSQNSHPHLTMYPHTQRASAQRIIGEEVQAPTLSQQTATPESSPFARPVSRYSGTATPRQIRPPPSQSEPSTPKSKLASQEIPTSSVGLAPAHRISSPALSESRTSHLSSPFMTKLSIVDQASKSRPSNRVRHRLDTAEPQPMQVDDALDTTLPQSSSSPPKSPPRPAAGGEMERIRQAMIQDRLVQYHDAESRRPEYLKRTKRSHSEAESTPVEHEPVVGIMESPIKGRRLKLFQETSEESFEESLMAGGYGRYVSLHLRMVIPLLITSLQRTADWIRQPQPTLLATPGAPGPSNVVSALEQAQEPAPPTEKELRKRKRLTAFTERTNDDGVTKLHPVELEGRGRVLLDIPPDGNEISVVEGSPSKKKGTTRRKKRGELSAREKKAQAFAAAATGDLPDKPNWPDAEFPWRLRTQEREEELKAEEAEKMKVIERFLDRDSDEEDEDDPVGGASPEGGAPMRRGRGKMVPIPGNPVGVRRKSFLFPSDPADARAALMSKKSVRTLSYRQEKRRRQLDDDESDDEVLCICNGRDDGRELVQCDDCQTWYHLQCIGIRDISELGREEDPWFCRRCEETYSSPSSEPELLSEPTFAPTDDRPPVNPSYDTPFFQPSLQDSPMIWGPPRMPRTPTQLHAEYQPGISSGPSWVDTSRRGPMTPQQAGSAPMVYTQSSPGPYDSFGHPYDEPFDPTSTPSRGMKFGPTFTTPKNNGWSARTNSFFQTPLKASDGRNPSGKTFGGPGSLSSALDDTGHSSAAYDSPRRDDESPIRRIKSQEVPKVRRLMESPLAARSAVSTPHHQFLEESPIMRYNTFNRR